jgi:hypothetical protein
MPEETPVVKCDCPECSDTCKRDYPCQSNGCNCDSCCHASESGYYTITDKMKEKAETYGKK